ncbi:GatB/YqeY domain-containing protein [Sphingoaurantiacus capsulatus]|uniref:GatB/YqeY domain-containing protein n=1 Tax=Sphingoaurantiacus capsulatus TaxID=1771310 RepID=A0ABV7XE96_9SPHN
MIRDDIKAATIDAMKARDERRVSALRMMTAAIKNKDIELRTAATTLDDDQVVADVLTKMAKQRRESIEMYLSGNRPELADAERAELAVIESFLPQQMDPAQAQDAVRSLVEELGAKGPQDMGRVMAELKQRFAGQIDMSRASLMVKQALTQ